MRGFANQARDELREELGPEYADLNLRDLDPRAIVKKHIYDAMNEAMDEGGPSARRSCRSPRASRLRSTRTRPDQDLLCTAASVSLASAPAGPPPPSPPRSPHRRASGTPSRVVPSMQWSRQGAAVSARRRSADPSRSRLTGDQATSGTERAEAPSTPFTAANRTTQSWADPCTRHQSGPTRRTRPATGPTPQEVEGHVLVDRRHQPADQGDRGVLGAAAVGQLTGPVGVVEGLGLLLEVVQDREKLLVPVHPATLPRARASATESSTGAVHALAKRSTDVDYVNGYKRRVFAVLLGDRGSRWRCLLVWASGTSTLTAVVIFVLLEPSPARDARESLDTVPLDRALVDLASVALLACAAWAWVVLSATVVEGWRGCVRCVAGRGRHPRAYAVPCWPRAGSP